MSSSPKECRLYGDFSWLWPVISPPEAHAQESEILSGTIREYSKTHVRTLLHLGCGGGHNDCTFKKHFTVTGTDISENMLELARKLNPEATYCRGDMRRVRLDATFDSVVALDSMNYMLTVEDLRAVFATAFYHLNPGGVFLTLIEQTAKTFPQNWTSCSIHSRDDMEVAFIENLYDPDPSDTVYEATLLFLVRRKGKLDIFSDRHTCGIFETDTWLRSATETGFEFYRESLFLPDEDPTTYPLLVCVKPA
ncbi:MAG: class I SAM-dependent methyltransferase [Dehalococcoidia bacterium]|nr:class I SAM-dependent methyltransferase [Dehalococcoidia bacterium]